MAFIEIDLPIEKLNPFAMAEGNAKKPVYQMHKWWARRLGSVFRMIILAAFSSDKESTSNIWYKFCNGANLNNKVVLDPFMGGGTTIVEALKLGCKVIGVDINPVAWFITKKEIESVDIDALDVAFHKIQKSAGRFIKQYYTTKCPKGHNADVMYYFWVKVARCNSCMAKVRLFTNYKLSSRNDVSVVFCPNCLEVFENNTNHTKAECPKCGNIFNPHKGVSSRGIFHCPICGKEQRILDTIHANRSKLDIELHALEGYCQSCGKFFKKVDFEDLNLWKRAKDEYKKQESTLLIPHQKIPIEGRSDPRPVNHGYTHFKDMFNERQLLCLSKLLAEIIKIPDINIRELMLIAFSDCLDANNMFCKYEIEWHKISLFFGLHAYHPIERPTENNVWGTEFGRGTFIKCFEKVRRAKMFFKKSTGVSNSTNNTRYIKDSMDECLNVNIVHKFARLKHIKNSALLRCDTAEELSYIPDKSIDAVITDPPYFDNIQYSELADFFYVWLRLGLKDLYPWFEPEYSGHPNEIVQNEKIGKTLEFFNTGLTKVFNECHRVIKDDGLLIFTFHHNKLWAWESIGKILLDSKFYVSACPIVRSEGKSGFHSSAGNIRYDCIFVCRKRPSKYTQENWLALKEIILKEVVMWVKRTLNSGMSVTNADIFAIIMGKTIEYYTKTFPNIKSYNEPITLGEALYEMKSFAEQISESAQAPEKKLPQYYLKTADQLTLFIRESKGKYEKTT